MSRRALLQSAVGLALSVLFGWLALWSVSVADIRVALDDARYAWLLPAAAALAATLWLRAMRWRALFVGADRARVTPAVAFWTLLVGLFFNSVLPARAGEPARAIALSHQTGIPRAQALVGVVVERFFDVACLAVLLLASFVLLPSGRLVHQLAVGAAVVLVLTAVGVLVLIGGRRRLRPHLTALVRRLPLVGGERAGITVNSLGRGVVAVLTLRTAVPVACWTLASWIGLACSNWLCMQAFSRNWPWHAAVFVLIATNFAMVVPATAGSLGVFEAAARAALAAYGIGGGPAVSYALVLHALNFVPYVLLGLPALSRLGLRAGELRRAAAAPDG